MKTEIFVFGSNLAGRHGKGAALHAKNHYGAIQGVGFGRTGNAYAIPTKDENLQVLPLTTIRAWCWAFIEYARAHPGTVIHLDTGRNRLRRIHEGTDRAVSGRIDPYERHLRFDVVRLTKAEFHPEFIRFVLNNVNADAKVVDLSAWPHSVNDFERVQKKVKEIMKVLNDDNHN
jgi:hypothetical protein